MIEFNAKDLCLQIYFQFPYYKWTFSNVVMRNVVRTFVP